MKQAVIRKTLTGDWEAFTFDRKAQFFFVKISLKGINLYNTSNS